MADSPNTIVQCTACGKRYRWKAEAAGKQVKCACGHLISIAQSAPAEDELYEIAEPKPTSSASTPLQTAAESPHVEVQRPPPVLAYQSPSASAAADDYFPDRIKDLYMPLVLLGIGIPVLFITAWWQGSGRGIGPMHAMTEVAAEMLLGTVIMLGAIFIAARRRGFKMGRFWPAVLKLSAVSLAPSAVMTLLNLFLRFVPLGGIINWIAGFCLYFVLIGAFFDLEESDTLYCVAIIFIVNVSIWLAATWLLH